MTLDLSKNLLHCSLFLHFVFQSTAPKLLKSLWNYEGTLPWTFPIIFLLPFSPLISVHLSFNVIYPSHPMYLIKSTMSSSPANYSTSKLDLLLQLSFPYTMPYILRMMFLSKVLPIYRFYNLCFCSVYSNKVYHFLI